MKFIITLVLVTLSFTCFPQSIPAKGVDSIKYDAKTVAREGAVLRERPVINGEIIQKIKAWTTLEVVGYDNTYYDEFYKVCINDTCGYVWEKHMGMNGKIQKIKKDFLKNKRLEKAREKEEELAQRRMKWEEEEKQQNRLLAERNSEKERSMVEKYGRQNVEKMKKGHVWIGMNEEQAIYSRGKPNDINRSVGSWGEKEQWVYGGLYLYFENGVLTSWQD